jgi:hypothetical protein
MEVAVVEVAEAAEAPADAAMTAAEAEANLLLVIFSPSPDAAMTAAEGEAHLLMIFSLSPQAQRQVQRCERVDALATMAWCIRHLPVGFLPIFGSVSVFGTLTRQRCEYTLQNTQRVRTHTDTHSYSNIHIITIVAVTARGQFTLLKGDMSMVSLKLMGSMVVSSA